MYIYIRIWRHATPFCRADQNPPTSLSLQLVEKLRGHWQDPAFQQRHKIGPKAFVRKRLMGFAFVFLFVLQKTTKSLQLHLQEFLCAWQAPAPPGGVSPGALTKARAKFKHQAYVELNQQCLVPAFYAQAGPTAVRRWRGHRLMAVDSSLVRLPNTHKLAAAFGRVECSNDRGKSEVTYPEARISVLYDVLNRLGVDAHLTPHTTGETVLAREHLPYLQAGDVWLCDRGYTGYFWLALIWQHGGHFVTRCSTGSFAAAQALFRKNEAGVSVLTWLHAPADLQPRLREMGLPTKLHVRFVTVRLSTGELEVLVTSLLDEGRYPTAEFAELYHWRWGIETYYGLLKGRLTLENWSGKTEEALRQDFQASVLVSNLESVLSRSAEAELAEQTRTRQTQPVQVNRSVSFHAVKFQILALLLSQQPAEEVIQQMHNWFKANPVLVRKERKASRKKIPPGQAYHYQKNVRKTVF